MTVLEIKTSIFAPIVLYSRDNGHVKSHQLETALWFFHLFLFNFYALQSQSCLRCSAFMCARSGTSTMKASPSEALKDHASVSACVQPFRGQHFFFFLTYCLALERSNHWQNFKQCFIDSFAPVFFCESAYSLWWMSFHREGFQKNNFHPKLPKIHAKTLGQWLYVT